MTVPPFDPAHHLFVPVQLRRGDFAQQIWQVARNLIGAEVYGLGGNERHVRWLHRQAERQRQNVGLMSDPCRAGVRQVPAAIAGGMSSSAPGHWTGIRISVIALQPNPVHQVIEERPCTSGVLISTHANTYTIGFIRRNFAEALRGREASEDDDPG